MDSLRGLVDLFVYAREESPLKLKVYTDEIPNHHRKGAIYLSNGTYGTWTSLPELAAAMMFAYQELVAPKKKE